MSSTINGDNNTTTHCHWAWVAQQKKGQKQALKKKNKLHFVRFQLRARQRENEAERGKHNLFSSSLFFSFFFWFVWFFVGCFVPVNAYGHWSTQTQSHSNSNVYDEFFGRNSMACTHSNLRPSIQFTFCSAVSHGHFHSPIHVNLPMEMCSVYQLDGGKNK